MFLQDAFSSVQKSQRFKEAHLMMAENSFPRLPEQAEALC